MRLDLHQKILLGVLLPVALVLLLFAGATVWSLRESIDTGERQSAGLEAHRMAVDLSAALRSAASLAGRTARLSELAMLDDDPDYGRWLDDLLAAEPALQSVGIRFEAHAGRPSRALLHRRGQDGLAPVPGTERLPEWYVLAREQGRPVWTPPQLNTRDGWLISHAVPFFAEGRLLGVAHADIALRGLPGLLGGRAAATPDDWLLVDPAGRLIHAREPSQLGRAYTDFAPAGSERAAVLAGLLQTPGTQTGSMDWPGLGRSYYGAAVVEPLGWLLLYGRAEAGLRAVHRPDQLRLLLMLGAVAAAALMAFFWLLRRYSRPLQALSVAVQAVARGEAPPPVQYRGQDELGDLVQSVGSLIEDLQARDLSVAARQRDLADRVREQHVLYRVADILGWVDVGFAEVLNRVAPLLPEAWARAESVCVRIDLDSHRIASEGFRETERGLFAPIDADGSTVGGVWVFALEPEAPLEASHQELLEGVAQQLGLAYRRERAQNQLESMNHELERRVEARTEALRQAERLLRDITNSMPGAVYQVFRPDGRPPSLRFVSAGIEQLFGVSREQALANFETILNRIHPEDYSGFMAGVSDAVLNDSLLTQVYRIAHGGSGETRWIRSSASIFREDGGALLNGYWIDVTDQKRLELALEQSRREADAANEAKSRFLANMSHEIRTPMNAIIGLTHLALGQAAEPKVREQLGKVEDAAQNLLGLLNDILDFSKIEAGRMSLEHIAFDLGNVLERIEGLMAERAADKGLRFLVEKPGQLPRDLVGDPLRLGQVLLNLVSNAIKFTEVGEVRLQVQLLSEQEQQVGLRFVVSDTGIGMDRPQLSRLFSAFTQADTSTTRRFGGTGLGLTISKELVGLMGGTLAAESAPARGSRFSFSLNLERADPDWRTPPVLTEDPAAALVGARLLLVDDNAINLEVAGEMLRQSGAAITTASNGREALALLTLGQFDAVLMDLQMPVMDGYTATRRIREQPRFRDLPILAMTANAMTGDREQCLMAGMNDHIPKPIDPEQLKRTLGRWLGKTLRPEPDQPGAGAAGR